MIRSFVVVALAGLSVAGVASSALAAGDAANGEKVFKKCMACHKVDGKNGVGPMLNGVVGRAAGSAAGYSYSELNKSAAGAGLVWSEDNIKAYLPDPNAFLKKFLTDKGQADKATGSTKMTFKLTDAGEIDDVIAFLKTKN